MEAEPGVEPRSTDLQTRLSVVSQRKQQRALYLVCAELQYFVLFCMGYSGKIAAVTPAELKITIHNPISHILTREVIYNSTHQKQEDLYKLIKLNHLRHFVTHAVC